MSGELDADTAAHLEGHLGQVTAESGPPPGDMTDVTFCDSSGLNAPLNVERVVLIPGSSAHLRSSNA